LTEYSIVVLEATAFLAVAAVFGILGWVGYALATTRPRSPSRRSKRRWSRR
jgi:hypothetical protein